MSVYTCITCRVAFADAELQRAHYKTDWHRYNLKRKVAEMPPVTAENFQQRVLAQRAQVSLNRLADEGKDTARNCLICGKHFNTQNAFDNHIQSKKHKEMEAKQEKKLAQRVKQLNAKNAEKGLDETDIRDKDTVNMALKERLQGQRSREGDDVDMDSEDDGSDAGSWEENMLGLEECLFCSYVSSSLEDNVSHMTGKHSFFIPDIEYMVDMEGLITYLGEKIGVGHVCLWCNEKGKTFHTAQAVQRHMVDKGHCKMLHEGDVLFEYTDFYDYRSSYPEEEGSGTAAVAGGSEDIDMEDAVEPESLISDGYELVLPSGATLGHRSLAKYYRQNVPPTRKETRSIVPRMLAQYKALGWTGATGVVSQQRVKDLGYMQRLKHRHFMRLGCKANYLQTHFRSQNPI
ncbi:cytoplasmic 60S subunit biogenesis factor ZNF622-like isoform X1 [Haliotis cracherodii]|uniref:cytoplasmic 60S subunit biogenesis factor ZNF622-like isoform X1 n=1 Tax=Haliotis cracherodii TaxID=6455 RepID=UPI0039E8F991